MQIYHHNKKKSFRYYWIISLLSLTACILLVLFIIQSNQINNSTKSVLSSGAIAGAKDTGQEQIFAITQQQADYETTIHQLQEQLKELKSSSDQEKLGTIPPPNDRENIGGDRGIIENTYEPLFNRMNLSTEISEKFKDYLVERRQVLIEIENEITNLSVSEDDRNATIQELEETAWVYDGQAQDILGYENYLKYNEYLSSRGIFIDDPVQEFEKKLRMVDEINTFQEEQLYAAMAEEFDDFLELTVPEANGPPGFIVGMRDEEIAHKIAAGLDDLQERYLTRASTILTESQMKGYENYIKSKISDRKLFYN